MKVLNTDLAKQLEASTLGARLWRLEPGQASTRHRHPEQEELYVLLEGTGRVRIGDDVLTLEPRAALVIGAPPEAVTSTLDMSEELLEFMYPDGPQALPPELD